MNSPRTAHTLGRWMSDRARIAPGRVAVVDRGLELGYGELERRAAALAEAFGRAGYLRGDRVATLTGTSADHVVTFFACAKAGLVLVPLSWRLTPAELAEQVGRSDPAVLLVEEEFATLARQALARLPVPLPTALLGGSGVEQQPPRPWRGSGEDRPPTARPVEDDDPLLMVFTSGSSGRPRAAVLTHGTCFWTNLSLSRTIELSEHDVVLAVLPQFHAGGWNIQPLLAWWTGATVVLERTFDAGRALRLIGERGITTMMAVPTQYLMMAEHRDFATTDFSRIRGAVVGGAPMPAPLLRTYHSRGVALTQGYGLTEAGPNVLCVPPQDATERVGYAGKPYPHVDVALADPVTGLHLEGAGTGELLVRGPGTFAGYFRDEEATRAVWRDGWLATGDVATRDEDGYLRIVDRLRNIYITGGENVAPAEVEQVLRRHPGVRDVVVVGVPDHHWGEVGVALVVARQGVPCDAQELLEHARAELAAYKVPALVHFVDALPSVGLEKVARPRALEMALAAQAASRAGERR
jgi:fatty-acyl-CoA synthase